MQNTLHKQAPWTPVLTVNPRMAAAKWVASLTEKEHQHLLLITAEIKETTVEEVLKQIDESPVIRAIRKGPPPDFQLVEAPSFKIIW